MQAVFLLTQVKEIWTNLGMMIMIPSQDILKLFLELIQKIDVDILHLKKDFDMGTLLTMYKTLLQRRTLPFETCRTEKLKR